MEPDHFSSWLERALAYFLAISPPLALLVVIVLFARRRPSIGLLLSDRWTVTCGLALGLLGTISGVLAPSQRLAIQGLAAIGLLFVGWVAGRFVVQDARRFWIDLQRGIAIVALVVLAWIVSPFTFEISAGPVTIPVARPHDPVAVFGLGANGLGPLLVFGAILALGRLHQHGNTLARIEALALTVTALVAALVIGVRGTVPGALVGALTLMLSSGQAGGLLVILVILIASATIYFRPEIWASLLQVMNIASEERRFKVWASAVRMARDHPWFGVGPFHFVSANSHYMAGDPDLPLGLGPHNIYLRMLAEWGIPSAALLFAWLLSWPIRLWARRAEIWRWSFVAGLVAFLVMGIFDDPLFTMHVSAPVFFGIGLAFSDLTSPTA